MTVNAAGEVHPALALIAERLAAGGGPARMATATGWRSRSKAAACAERSLRTGGMASDGDLLLAAFEAGRAAVFKVFGELADGSQLRSISQPNASDEQRGHGQLTSP